jgi:hypothetical protein
MSPRTFLISGLLAGLLAGVLAFVVASTFGETPINDAIAVEQAASHHADHADHADHAEKPVVSRENQSTWGLATATVVIGTVLGGAAGIGTAFLAGRLGRLTPPGAAVAAAAFGFVSLSVVPFLIYPPNPPAVGDPETIGSRTAAYFALLGLGLVATVVGVLLARRLVGRSVWLATVAGGAVFIVLIALAALALPEPAAVPDSFPGNTLYDFRIGSLMTQTTLWLTIAVALSGLLLRPWHQARAERDRRELAASL